MKMVASLALSLVMLLHAAFTVELPAFIGYLCRQSTIYQENYVDPLAANITFPQQKRNLIYIYLESMENSYMDTESGGALQCNVMPELTALAGEEENINFSYTDGIGGFQNMTGASWTIAAMVAQMAGIPLKAPIGLDNNEYGQDFFLPGVHTLTNVLRNNGYYQTLMVGSDANFGGRKNYFEQHGLDETFDIFTARKEGIVPEGYFVFWGMEDLHLFDFAKQKQILHRTAGAALCLYYADRRYTPHKRVCLREMRGALGCTIEEDRLGLGTNLFSGKKTLVEEMGYDAFEEQLAMSSRYYKKHFFEGE